GAKYKPVAQKVRPVDAELPEEMQLSRSHMPKAKSPGTVLDSKKLDQMHIGDGALTQAEVHMFRTMLPDVQAAFAFNNSEMGLLVDDVEPPVRIPTVEHKPWQYRAYPVAKGLYERVVELLQTKLDAGVLEPAIGAYANRWFVIAKKDKSKLR
ncbi:hypothetical protein DL89DRAFT_215830, partial [Linderina pennispora]